MGMVAEGTDSGQGTLPATHTAATRKTYAHAAALIKTRQVLSDPGASGPHADRGEAPGRGAACPEGVPIETAAADVQYFHAARQGATGGRAPLRGARRAPSRHCVTDAAINSETNDSN